MGFTSFDDLINQVTNNGKVYNRFLFKRGQGTTLQGNGVWHRTWNQAGIPGAGSEPAAGSGTPGAGGTAYSNTAGSINVPNQSPATKHVLVWGMAGGSTATASAADGRVAYALQDRLVGVGAISIATTGVKNLNTVALPRYTSGAGLEVWAEVTTTVTGGGAPAIHLSSYTNASGTAGQSGAVYTMPTNPVAGSMYPIPLADGDVGVQSIQTLTVDTLGTSGVINIIIVKQLGASIMGTSFAFAPRANIMQLEALPQVFDGASLDVRFQAATTSGIDIYGTVVLGYGG